VLSVPQLTFQFEKACAQVQLSNVAQNDSLATAARKRKAVPANSTVTKRTCRPTLAQAFSNVNLVTQSSIDEKVMNLVMSAVLPLHIVELPEFIDLTSVMQPNRQTMSHAALRLQIKSKSKEAKDKIIALLKEQSFIATTCDCWSTYGKSYIGVTVHWIDDALQRKSACLALRRMNGSHTFDAIAAVLDRIHAEFGIRRKIIHTTTDNGSNFINAF
jgi:hypothetical protein